MNIYIQGEIIVPNDKLELLKEELKDKPGSGFHYRLVEHFENILQDAAGKNDLEFEITYWELL